MGNLRSAKIYFTILLRLLIYVPTPSFAAVDHRGTEFWLVFTSIGVQDPMIMITSDGPVTGMITDNGGLVAEPFSLPCEGSTVVSIDRLVRISGSDIIEQKGIRVSSSEDITVFGLDLRDNGNDGFLALPTSALSLDHVSLAYRSILGAPSERFTIVATQDSTGVTIVPAADAGARLAGTPYSISLDSGESYSLLVGTATDNLTGSRVTADKPIAMFGSNFATTVPVGSGASNHLVEQLPGVDHWGTTHLSMPLATRTDYTVRVLSANDSTGVTIDGSPVVTLQANEFYETILSSAAEIVGSNPILVSHYAHGSAYDGAVGDPHMALVPPTTKYYGGGIFHVPDLPNFTHFLNVVVPDTAIGFVSLDGNPIPASEFVSIGSSGFSGAQIQIMNAGNHRLTTPQPISAWIYGWESDDSYGWPLGYSENPPIYPLGIPCPSSTPTPTPAATVTPTFTPTPEESLRVWPIPFNPSTAFGGVLKAETMPEGSSLRIFTVSGELVADIQPVSGRAEWDGKNKTGRMVSPGTYYYRIQMGKKSMKSGTVVVVDQ